MEGSEWHNEFINTGSDPDFTWFRTFFWGVEKVTPCTFNQQTTYVDHWLVGDHSKKTVIC
ncbi:MAG: hypothetical protein H0X62_17400 [Bacteroidetes bacterium]|nr:hypothetical protein [Bacteroidota bacterium]